MSSETTKITERRRLQEWAAQIRDCQSRPVGMSVISWCACHGITKANYYYRLRRVREACLETIHGEISAQQIVPVQPGFLHQEPKECSAQPGGGYFHKRMFHPRYGRNVPAAACLSSGGGAAC